MAFQEDGRVAKRYARALFGLTRPEQLEVVQGWLANLDQLWRERADLRLTFVNPAVLEEQRSAVIADLAQMVSPGDLICKDFLLLLNKNKRWTALPRIREVFDEIVAQFKKILNLEITSAFELPQLEREDMQRQIRERIPAAYANFISTTWKTDPTIVGGLIVRSGDTVLDGSLEGALERIGQELLV